MLYLIRMFLIGIVYLIGGLVGVICGILRPFNTSNVYPVARIFGTLGIKVLGIKLIVEGKEKIKEHHPCVIISNHQENLDIFPCSYMLYPRIVSLGKKSIKWFPIFGQFYWLSGNILIDRSNRKKALMSMKAVEDAVTKNNTSLWIMPEGTRSRGRGVLPFKKGAFSTAVNIQSKILPVCLSSYDKNLNLNKWHSGVVRIKVLDPIDTKGMDRTQVHELKERCQKMVSDTVKDLDQRV